MARARLVVATRKSALALAQCRGLMQRLRQRVPELQIEELGLTTRGDQVLDRSLVDIGGKGLFVKEIERALLDGRADVAVHSLKDVPPELEPGLTLGCFPEREDPRDAVVSRSGQSLLSLPEGSRIGTSSLRRRLQVLLLRPDFSVCPMRGNVDTRLRKCAEGEVDAVLLARCGLLRLGLGERATEVLEVQQCLPAVGQGALVVEHRQDDTRAAELLKPLHHPPTALAVQAERGLMEAVEGSCQSPVAAYAERIGDQLVLRGLLAEPDGSHPRRREARQPWPSSLAEAEWIGRRLGRLLKA